MAPKKERDDALNDFSARIFSAMLDEIVMDVVLQSHQEIARSVAVCDICHTRCSSAHVPGPSNLASSQDASQDGANGFDAGTSHSNGTDTPNGTIYLECTNCKRQIASNRYATHLSTCMGLSNARRGAMRNAAKARELEAGRSTSPFPGSENGNVSDDSKGTSKSKTKSRSKQADDAEFSLNKKRTGSPSVSPTKKSKKQKTTPAMTRVKTDPDLSGSPSLLPVAHTSLSKIPSKLRESSVLSSAQPDHHSSPESRYSSPAQSTASMSLQSPSLAGAGIPGKPKTKAGSSAMSARYSPPRPPPPVTTLRVLEPDYLVDVEGEETGSSTDTDSD